MSPTHSAFVFNSPNPNAMLGQNVLSANKVHASFSSNIPSQLFSHHPAQDIPKHPWIFTTAISQTAFASSEETASTLPMRRFHGGFSTITLFSWQTWLCHGWLQSAGSCSQHGSQLKHLGNQHPNNLSPFISLVMDLCWYAIQQGLGWSGYPNDVEQDWQIKGQNGASDTCVSSTSCHTETSSGSVQCKRRERERVQSAIVNEIPPFDLTSWFTILTLLLFTCIKYQNHRCVGKSLAPLEEWDSIASDLAPENSLLVRACHP